VQPGTFWELALGVACNEKSRPKLELWMGRSSAQGDFPVNGTDYLRDMYWWRTCRRCCWCSMDCLGPLSSLWLKVERHAQLPSAGYAGSWCVWSLEHSPNDPNPHGRKWWPTAAATTIATVAFWGTIFSDKTIFCFFSWCSVLFFVSFPIKTTSSCSQFQGQEADATPANDRKLQDQWPTLRGAPLALFFCGPWRPWLFGQAMSRADFSRPPIYTVYALISG